MDRFLTPSGNITFRMYARNHSFPTHRSELTFKEEQWQQHQESLKKRICELEDSLAKGKKSNSSQRKRPNADKEDIITEMYIIVTYM